MRTPLPEASTNVVPLSASASSGSPADPRRSVGLLRQRAGFAAVGDDDGAVDVAALGVDEEPDDGGDLLGFPDPLAEVDPSECLDELAFALLSALQGGTLLSQTMLSVQPLEASMNATLAYIRSFATDSPSPAAWATSGRRAGVPTPVAEG
jgi:hypothetical protein